MDNISQEYAWDTDKAAKQRQKQEAETIKYVTKMSEGWQKTHDSRTKEYESELLKEHSHASADEKLLLHLIAGDAAIAELFGKSELQVAQRLLVKVDDVRTALALSKVLRQVVACREVAARRIQELTQAVGVVRGQRRLSQIPHLRRVV